MTRSSIISHPPAIPMVIIRAEYLAICGGEETAAAVLNYFEHLTNAKLVSERPNDLWIYKSIREMQDELLNTYSDNTLSAAVNLLIDCDYLEYRRNPHNRMDKTWQYRLCIAAVQRHVNLWFEALLKNAECTPQFYGVDCLKIRNALLKFEEAIPETTTETTTKNDSSGRKRSPLQQANDALVNAIGAALGIPAVGKDYSNYLAQAKELVAAGIAQDEFTQYVEWMKALSKTTGNWDVTINALTTGGRMSKYIVRRKSAAPAISDTPTDPTELQRELEAELARNLNYGALMTGGGK
jgi:hypothetical protein